MSVIDKLKDPLKLIYSSSTKSGYVPRLPFAHYFLNSDGIKCRIHLQNFYSSFFPGVDENAVATFTIHSKIGDVVHKFSRELAPFGQIYLEMDEFADDDLMAEGMVFVDVAPGPRIRERFLNLPSPQSVSIGSPFWMSYRDENENYMYVHSISTVEGEVEGGIFPINWKLSRTKSGRPTWKSWRLLDVQLLDELQVVAMNHSTSFGKTQIEIFSDSGEVLWAQSVVLNPKQVERVKVPIDLISEWKTDKVSEHIRIGMDPLLSSNGKPYVVMKYAGGPLSLHHG